MKYLAGCAVALTLFAQPAFAQNRVELAPYSAWVASYDEDSCALQRQFGEEGQQAYLELRQFGREGAMQVVVASKDFGLRAGDFKVAFEPLDAKPKETFGFGLDMPEDYKGKLFSFAIGGDDPRWDAAWRAFASTTPVITEEQRKLVLQALDLDPDSRGLQRLALDQDYVVGSGLAREAFRFSEAWAAARDQIESEIDGILIQSAFSKTLFLRTGELHKPMEAMRTCLDELYSHWGIDVEAHKALRRPVIPQDYAKLVREVQKDYPAGMMSRGMQGYLRVRLNVAADGKPTACHMQSPINNDEAFERVACNNMMRHATFEPALDSAGQPIASIYQTSIVYLVSR